MKLIINHCAEKLTDGRYWMEKDSFDVSRQDLHEMWIALDLGDMDSRTDKEIEEVMQEQFDIYFNRPERNAQDRNNYKIDYFYGYDLGSQGDGSELFPSTDRYEDPMESAKRQIRFLLREKPVWAEIVIAKVLEDETFASLARRMGCSDSSIREQYGRAIKKLQKVFPNPSALAL